MAYAKASTSPILSHVPLINSLMLSNCSLYLISYFRLNSNLTDLPLKEITAILWSNLLKKSLIKNAFAIAPQHFYASISVFLRQSAFEYVNDVVSDEAEVNMHHQTFKKFDQNASQFDNRVLFFSTTIQTGVPPENEHVHSAIRTRFFFDAFPCVGFDS